MHRANFIAEFRIKPRYYSSVCSIICVLELTSILMTNSNMTFSDKCDVSLVYIYVEYTICVINEVNYTNEMMSHYMIPKIWPLNRKSLCLSLSFTALTLQYSISLLISPINNSDFKKKLFIIKIKV